MEVIYINLIVQVEKICREVELLAYFGEVVESLKAKGMLQTFVYSGVFVFAKWVQMPQSLKSVL